MIDDKKTPIKEIFSGGTTDREKGIFLLYSQLHESQKGHEGRIKILEEANVRNQVLYERFIEVAESTQKTQIEFARTLTNVNESMIKMSHQQELTNLKLDQTIDLNKRTEFDLTNKHEKLNNDFVMFKNTFYKKEGEYQIDSRKVWHSVIEKILYIAAGGLAVYIVKQMMQ